MTKTRKLLLMLYIICLPFQVNSDTATVSVPKINDITQSIIQLPLKQGITPNKAVHSMIQKADDLNMNIISHQKISAILHSKGIKSRHLEVLQLCTLEDAAKAIELNFLLAAYIPCRITVAADEKGLYWILLQNIDIQIDNELMNPAAVELAIRLNQNLLSIANAGVNGQ